MSMSPFIAETAPHVVAGNILYRRRSSKPASILKWLKQGNSVNVTDSAGTSLLHWFSSEGNIDAASLILDHGAELECRNHAGATPLLLALNSNQPGVARLMIDRGADCSARWNDGRTVLHCVSKWDIELIPSLLSGGADPTLPDKWGNSAIERMSTSEDGILGSEEQEIIALMCDSAGVKAPVPLRPEPIPYKSRFNTEEVWQANCLKIWENLVPANGQADSVQGELLRAVEKLRDEALRNGNLNWSSHHSRLHQYIDNMLHSFDIFSATVLSGFTADLATIGSVKKPTTESDAYDRICKMIVQLNESFPEPIPHEHDPKLGI